MPSSAQHRDKYAANRHHLNTGNNGAPLSTLDGCWAATVAFYAALHLVDRLAARINLHPGNHTERNSFVTGHHRPIWAAYNTLYGASRIARYGTVNQFNSAYPGTTVQDVLIDQRLVTIETLRQQSLQPTRATYSSGNRHAGQLKRLLNFWYNVGICVRSGSGDTAMPTSSSSDPSLGTTEEPREVRFTLTFDDLVEYRVHHQSLLQSLQSALHETNAQRGCTMHGCCIPPLCFVGMLYVCFAHSHRCGFRR